MQNVILEEYFFSLWNPVFFILLDKHVTVVLQALQLVFVCVRVNKCKFRPIYTSPGKIN